MVTPFDLFNQSKHADEELAKQRLSVCESCERLFHLTKQCKECSCIMPLKVKLTDASCPIGKW